jgi:hypothetical protein
MKKNIIANILNVFNAIVTVYFLYIINQLTKYHLFPNIFKVLIVIYCSFLLISYYSSIKLYYSDMSGYDVMTVISINTLLLLANFYVHNYYLKI